MGIKLETINRALAWLGLRLAVAVWNGKGDWVPTVLRLVTARRYRELCRAAASDDEGESSEGCVMCSLVMLCARR